MNFWFVTGTQPLYGEAPFSQIAENTRRMVNGLNASPHIPWEILWCPPVSCPEEISAILGQADNDKECAGVIAFMHTFSPAKMWIAGLSRFSKPYCHFHTQYNREIPWDTIDMDFMNLYQSAHGDREHGFLGARLRKPRKIIAGYWEHADVQARLGDFMRAAAGIRASRGLKVARFGDNMRQVAVTEGDKIEAEIRLGWSVNTYPVSELAAYVKGVSQKETEQLLDTVRKQYTLCTEDLESVRYQLRLEIGLRRFLERGGFDAFTTTFEDLNGLEQLPGLACQRLMADGYGFGAEGDWKTAALTCVMKRMALGLAGGTSMMEDYTYHLPEGEESVLGSHMLEVCPSIAGDLPRIEVHPLGIGGKAAPARLVFSGASGNAICASMVDMGGRLRLLTADVEAMPPKQPMPRLPVAAVMWKPLPELQTAAEAWLLAGGAHHTVMSYPLKADHLQDFAMFAGIEFIHIGRETKVEELRNELRWNELAYKLDMGG